MIRKLFQSELAKAVIPMCVLVALLLLDRVDLLPYRAARVVEAAADDGPSEVALDEATKHYYEGVLDVVNPDAGARTSLVGEFAKRFVPGGAELPEDFANIYESGAAVDVNAFLKYELKPDYDTTFRGAPLKTNRWGHRDTDDYELTKPPGTFRIALCGASPSFGSGAEAHLIYAKKLEERLNAELAGPDRPFQRYEVINFSMPGLSIVERAYIAEIKTPPFDPDFVLVTITRNDIRWMVASNLSLRISEGRDLYYEYLEAIVERAKITESDSRGTMEKKLGRFTKPTINQAYLQLQRFSEESGIPVAMLAMRLQVKKMPPSLLWPTEIAEKRGLPVLRVFEAYEGKTEQEMYLYPGRDDHPSPTAHQLLADEIFTLLLSDPGLHALIRGDTPATD